MHINTPDMVHFKIEPSNATKVLTFYSENYNDKQKGMIGEETKIE